MAQTESEIISRCQCGDKAAFRWVVEHYQRMLFSLALKMLANEEEAKDVVQETFIRVWKGIRNYDPEKSFATWLYTIGSRLCLDHLKTMKPIVSQPDDISVLKHYAGHVSDRTMEELVDQTLKRQVGLAGHEPDSDETGEDQACVDKSAAMKTVIREEREHDHE